MLPERSLTITASSSRRESAGASAARSAAGLSPIPGTGSVSTAVGLSEIPLSGDGRRAAAADSGGVPVTLSHQSGTSNERKVTSLALPRLLAPPVDHRRRRRTHRR